MRLKSSSHSQQSKRPKRSIPKGMTLIEIAVLLVFISLAMIPVIRTIGSNTHSAPGDNRTFTAISRQQSHTLVAANSILESALAGDINVLATNTLTPGQVLVTNRQQYTNDYSKQVWYDWSLRDTSYKTDAAGNVLYYDAAGNVVASGGSPKLAVADGNQLVQATLRVYSQANGGTPILQLPTVLFRNNSGVTTPSTKVGIMMVQDVSGSMSEADASHNLGQASSYDNVASPYLYYRFGPAKDPSALLNMWDNSQLDLVGALDVDNPSTNFINETYPVANITGLTPNYSCATSSNWSSANYNASVLKYYFIPVTGGGANTSDVTAICGPKTNLTDATTKINQHLSRIEASRTGMFNFLINTESNPSLLSQVKLGLITFDNNIYNNVALESPQLVSGAIPATAHYKNMRETVAWVNRAKPTGGAYPIQPIVPAGSTQIYGAIKAAADRLYADTTLNQRIILILTDGAPNPNSGNNTYAGLTNFCNQVGNARTYTGAPLASDGQKAQITLFAIGLIEADKPLMTAMANNTPGGVALFAESAADLSQLFEEIAYQIQKTIYLNASNRYNF